MVADFFGARPLPQDTGWPGQPPPLAACLPAPNRNARTSNGVTTKQRMLSGRTWRRGSPPPLPRQSRKRATHTREGPQYRGWWLCSARRTVRARDASEARCDFRWRGGTLMISRPNPASCNGTAAVKLPFRDPPGSTFLVAAELGRRQLRQSGPLPRPLPERLAVTGGPLGDRVGEILLFCRSAARHTVSPAGPPSACGDEAAPSAQCS
jgi:hypothetical protein